MEMSNPLSDRLRAALARKYDVERELGAGGMGTVYLARDVTLERSVAVKILRPELATATAAERFLREARILANLNHPNVVPVHSAGEEDGLFYYVMEYVHGETLAERLARGPLSEDAAVRMGRDLLDALETVHEHGIIHRDVKPGNIFLVGDRVLLGDFGLAKPVDEESPPLTQPGQGIGTPAYMPPEQASGNATKRTDLYAVGMVVYEAITGRRWSIATPSDEVDWSGVPRRLVPVLRKALNWKPDDRWESAGAFRAVLGEGQLPGGRRKTLRRYAAGAIGLIALAVAYFALRPTAIAIGVADLAILPFSVRGVQAGEFDGAGVAHIVRDQLQRLPDVRIVPTTVSFPWYSAAEAAGSESEQQAAAGLNARFAVGATVIVEEDVAEIDFRVFDSTGEMHPESGEIQLGTVSLRSVSDSITRRLQTVLLGDEDPEVHHLTPDPDALASYANGEKAFARGDWALARQHYERAIHYDSAFIQAWWHLATAYRWLGESGPYPADYGRLFELYAGKLGSLDSLLMAAQLEPAGPGRLAAYRTAVERYPQDDFAAFLLGEELFNRGALWGESLEEAAAVLEEAVRIRSSWSSSYLLLVWAYIRLGRAEDAVRVLEAMPTISASLDEGWQLSPELLRQAYEIRFMPEEAASNLQRLMADTVFSSPEWLAPVARLAGSFDIPKTQVLLGSLLSQSAVQRFLRAGGFEAAALGHVMLGQTELALAGFDSAAALFGTPESRLQAAEWRVLPPALGMPMATDAEMDRARSDLESMLNDPIVARRAAWALAVDAYAAGDTVGVRGWAQRMQSATDPDSEDGLDELLAALDLAVSGRFRDALAVSEGLLALQAATRQLEGGVEPPGTLGDNFARALLHLKRGEWYARLGDGAAADGEWRWYEAVDINGFPVTEPAQAGEVDWALGTFARYLRGTSAFERGEFTAACEHLNRVAELWSDAVPEFSGYLSNAATQGDLACNQLQAD